MSNIRFTVGYRTVLSVIVAFSFLPGSLMFASDESREPHRRVGVIVSNSSYASFDDAAYAHRDGEDFHRYLTTVRGFHENAIIRRYDSTKPLLDELFGNKQNSPGLLSSLLATSSDPYPEVVVFYSGHGMLIDGKAYLLPSLADVTPDYADLYPIDSLYKSLEATSATVTVVLYIDTWYGTQSGAYPNDGSLTSAATTVTVLAASSGASKNELDVGHERFKNDVLDGLYGGADEGGNRDGKVDLQELTEFLQKLYMADNLSDESEVPSAWTRTSIHVSGEHKDLVLAKFVGGNFPAREPLSRDWTSEHLSTRREVLKSTCPDTIQGFLNSNRYWQYKEDANDAIRDLNDHHNKQLNVAENGDAISRLYEYRREQSSCASYHLEASKRITLLLREMVDDCRQQSPRFKDCNDDCPEMVVVNRRLALGRYEITRAEFDRYVTERPSDEDVPTHCWTYENVGVEHRWARRAATWINPGFYQDDSHPVTCVNWSDASQYAEWLSKTTGKRYRLPTLSEWESVAIPKGSEDYRDPGQASDGMDAAGDPPTVGTVAVITGAENDEGLYHMNGNVWEWVNDCWDTNECQRRVLLGGSWWDLIEPPTEDYSRIVGRNYNYRISINGFRVARTLISPDVLDEAQLIEELRATIEPVPMVCIVPDGE